MTPISDTVSQVEVAVTSNCRTMKGIEKESDSPKSKNLNPLLNPLLFTTTLSLIVGLF